MCDKYSSDQFPDQRFSLHGRYEIWKEDDTFMVSVEGPFNLESVIAMGKTRHAALTAWGCGGSEAWVVIFQTSMLMSLEALNTYSDGLQRQLQASGPVVALAWVAAPDIEGRSIMLDHFSHIFSRFQVSWKVFEKQSCAKAWVQDRLKTRTAR